VARGSTVQHARSGENARSDSNWREPDTVLVGSTRVSPVAEAGACRSISVCRTITHLLVEKVLCRFSRRRERLIPHASTPPGPSPALGEAVILASFPGLTVAAARGSNARAPGLLHAGIAAVAAALPLASAAQ
jgi:hypothetical protein